MCTDTALTHLVTYLRECPPGGGAELPNLHVMCMLSE